jgi:type II secretory pathway component PulF
MSGAETSGSDVQKASRAFTDGADQIQGQVQQVAASRITGAQAGRKFHQAGESYKQTLDKLKANIKSFGDHGTKLSESFGQAGKEYQSSDESGSQALGKVKG